MKHFGSEHWSSVCARLSAAALMLCLPACGTTSGNQLSRNTTDRSCEFSARCPSELNLQRKQQSVPVEAVYPGDTAPTAVYPNSANNSTEDGVTFLKPSSTAMPSPTMMPSTTPGQTVSRDRFQLTSHQLPENCPPGAPVQNGFIQAEPRMECPPSGSFGNAMETVAAGPSPDRYADEYLIDGGDRGAPVQTATGNRYGLDSEDTVAKFADHSGAERIKPSNRVAVYSPRFGSIRTVSGLEADVKVDGPVGARAYNGTGNLITGAQPAASVRSEGLEGLASRRRADGANTALPAVESRDSRVAALSRKVDKGLEGRKVTGPFQFETFDSAMLSQQARNAVVWTRKLFPQITASTSSAGEIRATFRLQQTIGLEDERKTKGDIRIVKLADRESAQSGDTVVFTIHFENTGDFDVYDVQIVDNLTPRLQYVPDSGSLKDGTVTVGPNGEGSQILTFTLNQPLKGHASGTITFEAKVR